MPRIKLTERAIGSQPVSSCLARKLAALAEQRVGVVPRK